MHTRNVGLLATRVVLGGYLAVHGAQKLFGAFDGPGLDALGTGFESMGMRPGKPMATLAGASEFGGGLLTVAGLADPLGPMAIAGTMVVASAVHRKAGPMGQKGGYELPLTNLAVAIGLISTGPGRFRLGRGLPSSLSKLAAIGGAGLAAVSLAQMLRFTPEAPDPTDEGAEEPEAA